MDKNELIDNIRRNFADLLNNSEIKTTEKAKEIANALLQQGVQPTWRLIREVLGTGSATTLQNVVNNYWVELGQRLNHLEKRADVPEVLVQEFNKLWDKSLKQAKIEIESRLKDDFDEARTIKNSMKEHLTTLEENLEQLQRIKVRDEKQYAEDIKILKTTLEQLSMELEQEKQQVIQLQERYQQAENTSQLHQQQAKQFEIRLNAEKQEYQQITKQLRVEQLQTVERQAEQYESMIDHYANELGQLKVIRVKNDKDHKKEKIEWQKQQQDTVDQSSRLQIENAMLKQENQQIKKIKYTLQEDANSHQSALVTLEKEKSTLQAHCTFFKENNMALQNKLNKIKEVKVI